MTNFVAAKSLLLVSIGTLTATNRFDF